MILTSQRLRDGSTGYSELSCGVEESVHAGLVTEGWDNAAGEQTHHGTRSKVELAPEWFDGWISVVLQKKSLNMVVRALMVAAPFVASVGYVLEFAYGCATVSAPVDAMLGVGIFVFTCAWFFQFRGLVEAVRGAHRGTELVEHEQQYLVEMKTQRKKRKARKARNDLRATSPSNRSVRTSSRPGTLSPRSPPPPPSPPPVENIQLEWADIDLQKEATRETLRDELLIRELGVLYTERQGLDELSWMRTSDYIPGSTELLGLKRRTFSEQETGFIRTHPSFQDCDKSKVTLDQLRKWALAPTSLAGDQSDAASDKPPERSTANEQSENSTDNLVSGLPATVPGLHWQFKPDDESGWKDFDEAAQSQLSKSAVDGMQSAQVTVAGEKFDADLSDTTTMTLTETIPSTASKESHGELPHLSPTHSESVRRMPMRARRPRFSNTSIELIDKAFGTMSYEGRTLYVTNVLESMNDEELRDMFSKVGTVASARVYVLQRSDDDDGTLDERITQAGDSQSAPIAHYGIVTMETPECIAKALEKLRKYEMLSAEKVRLVELVQEQELAQDDTGFRLFRSQSKKQLQAELDKASQALDAFITEYSSRFWYDRSLFGLKWQLLTYEMIPATKNVSLHHLMVPNMAKFSVHHLHDVAQQQYEKELRMKSKNEAGAIAFVTDPSVQEGTKTGSFPVVSLGGIALLSHTSTSRLRADGIGVERVELDANAIAWLHICFYITILLAATLLVLVVFTLVAFVSIIADHLWSSDDDILSEKLDGGIAQFFFPPVGCISNTMQTVYAVLLVICWVPAAMLFSVVYPAWQLSLCLAVTLAQDAVDDLMKDLGPLAAQQYLGEDTGRATWITRVQQPCTMIVSTLKVLSAWVSLNLFDCLQAFCGIAELHCGVVGHSDGCDDAGVLGIYALRGAICGRN
eukprot:COSAG02_NODE_2787_length_8027_cov_10.833375_4_plen_921_part_00